MMIDETNVEIDNLIDDEEEENEQEEVDLSGAYVPHAIQAYFNSISQYPLLTKEEEEELGQAILDGVVKNITDYGAFIDLGGVDGLTLAKEIKKLNSKVNIIFLTVCDEKEYAKEVLEIKPSGYLVKPANKEQIALELSSLRYNVCPA